MKRKIVTLETKYEAVRAVEKGTAQIKVAEKMGVPRNTLCAWMKKANEIKKSYETGVWKPSSKRMRTAAYADVEEALEMWFAQARGQNIAISGPILQTKASLLAKELGHNDFKCSDGWLHRFKQRKGISFRVIRGEAHDVDGGVVEGWRANVLAELLTEYEPARIYNADECGLFFRMQPARSLVGRDEDGRDGWLHRFKERKGIIKICLHP
jgi:hypothetical protein